MKWERVASCKVEGGELRRGRVAYQIPIFKQTEHLKK